MKTPAETKNNFFKKKENVNILSSIFQFYEVTLDIM